MELTEVIRTLRSVRASEQRDVESQKVVAVLEAARAAPSAGNLEDLEIFKPGNRAGRSALARAANEQYFLVHAPVVQMFCANPAQSASRDGAKCENLLSIQAATIACTSAMLAATSLGLASVWVGAFDESAVRRVLDRPDLVHEC